MNPKNNAADKVRPILRAMEQSIEAARSTRTQPIKTVPAPVKHLAVAVPAPDSTGPSRLKARPKRAWM
jgi:hypothetical protein